MDALSEVLRAVKLEGALFFNGEFSAPWCFLSSRAADKTSYLTPHRPPGTCRLIMYHYLIEGRAYARIGDGPNEALTAGDVIIFPHGDAHYVGNGSPEKPVDSFKTFARNFSEGLKVVRYGGGGEMTRFVCGFLACEPRMSEAFLAGLPKMLKVRIGGEPSSQWIENSIRFSAGEGNAFNAGSAVVLAKLSEVLFMETLRRYVSVLPHEETGWLAGARDPIIGQALALLHKETAHPWTISELAKRVGLSRTRLAERFRHFLGESPIAYLAQWRLKVGAEILQSSDDSIAEVAAAVGYGSEAAFNRAFKREFDCPPAQFRRQRKAQTASV